MTPRAPGLWCRCITQNAEVGAHPLTELLFESCSLFQRYFYDRRKLNCINGYMLIVTGPNHQVRKMSLLVHAIEKPGD